MSDMDSATRIPTPEDVVFLTFNELQEVNARRAARWHDGFGERSGDWTGSDWSNAAAGEMGEACNVVKKLRRAETGHPGVNDPLEEDLVDQLADEIADTMIYLDLLASYYGIDTAIAVRSKFNKVSVRENLPEGL